MNRLKNLFENNRAWAEAHLAQDPDFFKRIFNDQNPKYMWIGCSDSRVPANEIVGLDPGQLFVHRNVANLFPHTDFNCLSALELAVDFLRIEHVIVCGHYGCGGVGAAMRHGQLGLVDNWLRHIRDVNAHNQEELEALSIEDRYDRLVELNVQQQVHNVCHTTIVQNAWARKQPLSVHGWVYDMKSGFLRDIDCCFSNLDQLEKIYLTKRRFT